MEGGERGIGGKGREMLMGRGGGVGEGERGVGGEGRGAAQNRTGADFRIGAFLCLQADPELSSLKQADF